MTSIYANRNVDCPYCGETHGTTIEIDENLEPVEQCIKCFNFECEKEFKVEIEIDIDVYGEEIE